MLRRVCFQSTTISQCRALRPACLLTQRCISTQGSKPTISSLLKKKKFAKRLDTTNIQKTAVKSDDITAAATATSSATAADSQPTTKVISIPNSKKLKKQEKLKLKMKQEGDKLRSHTAAAAAAEFAAAATSITETGGDSKGQPEVHKTDQLNAKKETISDEQKYAQLAEEIESLMLQGDNSKCIPKLQQLMLLCSAIHNKEREARASVEGQTTETDASEELADFIYQLTMNSYMSSLATCHYRLNNMDKAEFYYKKSLEISQNISDSDWGKLDLGDEKMTTLDYKRMIQFTDGIAYNRLGQIIGSLSDHRRIEEAVNLLENARRDLEDFKEHYTAHQKKLQAASEAQQQQQQQQQQNEDDKKSDAKEDKIPVEDESREQLKLQLKQISMEDPDIPNRVDTELVTCYYQLASLSHMQHDEELAVRMFSKLYGIFRDYFYEQRLDRFMPYDRLQLADVARMTASFYLEVFKQKGKAKEMFAIAAQIYDQFIATVAYSEDQYELAKHIVGLYGQLAPLCVELSEYKNAELYYLKAYHLLKATRNEENAEEVDGSLQDIESCIQRVREVQGMM